MNNIFPIFVAWCAVKTSLAVDNGHDFVDDKALENVFGKHRMDTHFTSMSAKLTPHDRKLLGIDEAALQIACASTKNAANTEKLLVARFGENNVHPAYSSNSGDSICFVTTARATALRQMQGSGLLRSVSSVPSTLKVHESVMYILGLIDEDTPVHSTLKKMFGKDSQQIDLERAKLIISDGVAVKRKNDGAGASILATNIRNALMSTAPHSHLHEMTVVAEDEASVWRKSAASLAEREASAESCSFHELSIKHTGHSIEVGNLHHIERASESPSACFAALLAAVASRPTVSDIRFRTPKRALNNVIRGIVQADYRAEEYPYTKMNITGAGQVVGIGDTGLDERSCFFRNADGSLVARSTYKNPTFDTSKRKVIQYISYCDGTDTQGGHGTHVAGTVGGNLQYDSTTYSNYNGHGSGAKIAFFDMEYSKNPQFGILYPSPIGDNVFQPAYDAGARLHSNSWGGSFNIYDDDTADIDDFQNTHPDFLALFAAGNDGSEGYYSMGDPAVSKNALSIGCSMSSYDNSVIDHVAFFSSMGPTYDNRIKPDVVAPGYFTYSAKAAGTSTQTCEITGMAGTSMATPAVAGTASQIRQYFADYANTAMAFDTGCSYFTYDAGAFTTGTCAAQPNPRGSTVKAMLVNSGEPMGTYDSNGQNTVEPYSTLAAPPDMYQGFGRVSLQNVLPYPGIEEILETHVIEYWLSANQQFTHQVTVGDNTRPFKATLVWMDPTNSVISAKMLINNLDLQVEAPDGTVYYGNDNGADDVNNVEQITITAPAVSGTTYKVRVTSGDYLYGGSQWFSLVVTGGDLAFASDSVASSITFDPLDCAAGERLVRMTVMDRDADGWSTGQYFQIANSDNSVVRTGQMTGADKNDFLTPLSWCLPFGTYTAELLNSVDTDNMDEMAFDVDTCKVYLSQYHTSREFTITNATSDYCGACPGYELSLLLAGSFYGVPYGWRDDTHYSITQTEGGDTSYLGTLATGMLREHRYCLNDGAFSVRFNNLPMGDDFLDDDYLANYFGVEEYVIYLADSSGNRKTLYPGGTATISVSGSSGTMKVENDSGGNDDDDSYLSAAVIVAIVVVLVLAVCCCVGAGIYYFMCRRPSGTGSTASTLETTSMIHVGK